MAIQFEANIDASGFVRGSQDMADAIEDTTRVLEDLERTADSVTEGAGQELGQNVESGARDAGDAVERLERQVRDSLENTGRASRDAGDSLGRNLGDGAEDASRRASEGISEFGDEADGTAREVAASFDGSAESIVGGFQEVAANAFAGFGPAGAAAGLAAAAGIGLLTKKLDEAKERAQAAAEEVAEITGQLIELKAIKLDDASVKEAIEEMGTSADGGSVKIQKIADTATAAGISFKAYVQGLAGDGDQLQASYDEVITKQQEMQDGLAAFIASYDGVGDAQTEYYAQTYDQVQALEDAKKALEAKDGTLNKSAETYELVTEATEGYVDATDESTDATKSNTEALEEKNDASRAAADSTRSLFDAETNLAKTVADSTKKLKENAEAGLDPSTEKGRANREAISGMAGAYDQAADAILAAGGTQADANKKIDEGRDAVIKQAEAMGIGKDKAEKLADQLGLIPGELDVSVKVSDGGTAAETKTRLDALGKAQTANVKVEADTSEFDKDIAAIQRRTYRVNMQPRIGKPQAV
jgi:hypothetical protein